ncbi:hypothetical protein [Streptomyces termitum]|uniref:hypothetical protein n=1 Tax=Streptomyces termitum TaxID=67368 RepID=UPI00379B9554
MAHRPHTPALPRLAKAVPVSLLAVGAAHVILSDTLGLGLVAEASSALGSPTGYSSDQAFTTALMNTALVLPIVLWIGMRVTGERRTGPMLLIGTATWLVVVWRGVDTITDTLGGILPLDSLALAVAVIALSSLVRRRSPAPAPSPAPVTVPAPASGAAPSAPASPPASSAPIRPENVSETTPAS